MKVFPAIDIIDGQVVRLTRGDYDAKTVYRDSPVEQAKLFEAQGAQYLHVVDLDAAKTGKTENAAVICQIAKQTDLFVEIGGGIRSEETIEIYRDAGLRRVILGTAALRDPDFLQRMVERYRDFISVGVDARDGKVAVNGWLEVTDADSVAFCEKLRDMGVAHVVYTDIAKDGALGGTNRDIYRVLCAIDGLDVTASGGVSTLGDIRALAEMRLYGCIIGKALYENRLSLEDALRAAQEEQ